MLSCVMNPTENRYSKTLKNAQVSTLLSLKQENTLTYYSFNIKWLNQQMIIYFLKRN